MSVFSASAPGKIFLLGEYSVLEGHGALIGAVGRRVAVRYSPEDSELRASSSLWPQPLVVSSLNLRGETGRVAAGIGAALEFLGECDLPLGRLAIDSSALFARGRKLGFGSSAAVVVSVMGAILHASGVDISSTTVRGRAFPIAKCWHNAAQGAAGSGGDVAASLFGGVTHLAGDDSAQALAPLGAMAVFTHEQEASTSSFIKALRAWAQTAPGEYVAHMATLGRLTGEGVLALQKRHAPSWLSVLRQANLALAALGTASGLPIVTAAHRALAAVVEEAGGACKPAGAGGGDLSLIAARDAAHLRTIRTRLLAAGFATEELVFSREGLT